MNITTPNRPPDPGPIMQLATGYWGPAVMLAANKLGLFPLIAEQPRSNTAIAEKLGLDVRALNILLDACCALGLTEKVEGGYRASTLSSAYLTPGKPGYLGNAIGWSADQYEAWGRLAETVKSGQPAVPPKDHLGGDPGQTRAFVMGMYDRAMGMARGVLDFLDLEGCHSLLDVGGGSGAYSMLLAGKFKDLHATILDLPGIVEIAKDLITEQGYAERVSVTPGDAKLGNYGAEMYDAVLFSGVLHQMSPKTIVEMLEGAYRALKTAGKVIISDMMLEEDKTQPIFSALFSVQMLLTSNEGAVFSAKECEMWLGMAGFSKMQTVQLPPPLPYMVVSAVKTS
jgi:precorrin-6B methylase 2